jgi:hypothetical protein
VSRDRPVELVLFAGLDDERAGEPLHLLGDRLDAELELRVPRVPEPVLLAEHALLAFGRRQREPLRQEKVAGVPVLHADHVSAVPEPLDLLRENDFHVVAPSSDSTL